MILRSDENVGPFCSSLFVASNDFYQSACDCAVYLQRGKPLMMMSCQTTPWMRKVVSMMVCVQVCCRSEGMVNKPGLTLPEVQSSRSCYWESNECSLCVGYRLQLIMYFITSWMNNFFFTAPVSGWDLPGSMWTSRPQRRCVTSRNGQSISKLLFVWGVPGL